MASTRDNGSMASAVRKRVCVRCNRQPADGPANRPCEPGCPIFVNLTILRVIAESLPDEGESPYRVAINRLICQSCKQRKPLGDQCENQLVGSCPLSVYTADVVAAIEAAA